MVEDAECVELDEEGVLLDGPSGEGESPILVVDEVLKAIR
jgi:hypothetical protein